MNCSGSNSTLLSLTTMQLGQEQLTFFEEPLCLTAVEKHSLCPDYESIVSLCHLSGH